MRNRWCIGNAQIQVRGSTDQAAPFEVGVEEASWPEWLTRTLALESEILDHVYIDLAGSDNVWSETLKVSREYGRVTDICKLTRSTPLATLLTSNKSLGMAAWMTLQAASRKFLQASKTEASVSGVGDEDWARYRDAQLAVLNRLSETQESITAGFTRKMLEAEEQLRSTIESKRVELEAEYAKKKKELDDIHEIRTQQFEQKDALLTQREKDFETNHARYVSRKNLADQVSQLKADLERWGLTEKTTEKRKPVFAAAIVGAVVFALLAVWWGWISWSFLISAAAKDLAWWQWAMIAFRPAIPTLLAAGITLFIIRWLSSWANAHAEEEFRMRARLADIGRASWLLEAVRDAAEKGSKLPEELLHDLSRNLFATAPNSILDDGGPHSPSELMMRGMNSVSVEVPGGKVDVRAEKK